MEVADLYVVLRSVGTQFEKGVAEAGLVAERTDGKIASMGATIAKLSLVSGAAAIGVGIAAVKMSTEFDKAMTQLVTEAHVPKAALKELGAGVLALAGQVGFSPLSLAQALYHVESTFASTGITSKKAMDILRIAAEGAAIGGANLVDVTNALDAAVVSGIPGVQNISQAMGALLSIVGSGDMTMQNLADALGTGILAIGKQYGATLADIGAALATFGDNNIRGSEAATYLRMSIMDLTKQSGTGEKALANIGIAAGQLGQDMQKGGLNAAILDLHNHLDAAGITGTAVGKVLEEAFTKRSSAPLAVLLGELGQFESKYPELAKGAGQFGSAWQQTAALISQKARDAKANVEAAFIGLGHMLAPIAAKILDVFNGAFSWVEKHKKTMQELGGYIKTFVIGALIVAATVLAGMAAEALVAAAPFIALSIAVGLLAKHFYGLYEHSAKFRAFVHDVVTDIKDFATALVGGFTGNGMGDHLSGWQKNVFEFGSVVREVLTKVVQFFRDAVRFIGEAIRAVIGFYHEHKAQIQGMLKDVTDILTEIGHVFLVAFDTIKAVVKTAVKIVMDLWDRFGSHIWSHVVTAWHAIVQVIKGALELIKGIFEVVTGILTGKWSKVWKGITDIFGGAWNVIVGIAKAVLDTLSSIIGAGMAAISAAWGFVWHAIETMAKSAWNGIKVVGGWLFDWFVKLPMRILGYFVSANVWLFNKGMDLLSGLWNGIKKVWGTVVAWFKGLGMAVLNFFADAGEWLFNVGAAIFQGLWDGIKKVWNDMTSWLSSVGGWISNLKGPIEKDRQLLVPHGKAIMAGLNEGLVTGFAQVKSNLNGMANKLSGAVKVGITGSASGSLAFAGVGASASGSGPVGGGAGVGSGDVLVQIIVQGSLIDEPGLIRAVQQAMTRNGGRNKISYQQYARR